MKQFPYNAAMESSKGIYPIRVVARKTGLSPFLIRSWEKRYGAVVPQRTDTNRRLYSDDDIARLSRLSRAVNAGHSISNVAALPDDELEQIIADERSADAGEVHSDASTQTLPAQYELLQHCLDALDTLDGNLFEEQLENVRVALTLPVFLEQIIAPLMTEAGRRWQSGQWRIAHEHLASAVVRRLLLAYPSANRLPAHAPVIIVATPAGQNHEIGALMARSVAVAEGWRDVYLGPDTPAAEIVHAARVRHAKAIALSIVYPPDDPHLPAELDALATHVPPGLRILVGGAAAPAYRHIMERAAFLYAGTLPEFREELARLRA